MSGTAERGRGASGSYGTGPVMMPGSAPLPMRGGGRTSWAVAPVISRLASEEGCRRCGEGVLVAHPENIGWRAEGVKAGKSWPHKAQPGLSPGAP